MKLILSFGKVDWMDVLIYFVSGKYLFVWNNILFEIQNNKILLTKARLFIIVIK